MKSYIIIYAFLLFFLCLLIHIALWRLRHPKSQVLTLLVIFFVFPVLLNALIHIFSILFHFQSEMMQHISQLSIGERLQIYLLLYALSSAYILSYPATQAGSPSLAILLVIKSSMPEGITKEEIFSFFKNRLFEHRITDLVDESLVMEKDGWLKPTKKGYLLLNCFVLLRKIFGLPIGKG